MPANLFHYELLPFFEDPKELLVLKCIDRAHLAALESVKDRIITHFETKLKGMESEIPEEKMIELRNAE